MKLIFRWFIVLFAIVQSVIADPLKDRNRPVAETDALSPEQTVASFSLPDGFSANVFAAEPDIVQPIGFATDDRGRTWVLENTNYPVCPGEKAILNASASNGRKLFSQRCAACHILHGEGAKIGPELPGNFKDVDYLLLNILDPNATIGKDYLQTFVTKTNGQIVSGVIISEAGDSVSLKTLAGDVAIPRSEIGSMETSEQSLMPEGLMTGLEEPEIRDLFLYLRQSEQVPLPAE